MIGRMIDMIFFAVFGCSGFAGLFEQLHPATEALVVLGVDPDAGDHELEREQRTGRNETDNGKTVDQSAVGFAFLIIVHSAKRRSLGRAGGCR